MAKPDDPEEQQEQPIEESDSEAENVPKVKSLVDKRRARSARFSSWLLKAAEKSLNAQIRREEKIAADEELSIRALLAQNESTPIITDPREYQIELFERAKTQNTIAVLDTGSGKTLIAVLLLRHVIDQELEDRRQGKPDRIAFFLVPSVTLVFQQFAVLERNLDHSVDRFCGAMKCDLWTREVWDQHFKTNKIIVCTADVLHQCLMHSFITMHQINLLIFDEAHHAKKEHAYAKIIRDFYLQETNQDLRPRIFGMTASPVDAKVDVVRAASDLEDILCSRIATTADMALLQKTIVRPHEEIVRYLPGQKHPLEPDLYCQLKSRFGSLRVVRPLFRRAIEINSHLGHWCSDFYWTFALAENKAHKMESKTERRPSGQSMAQNLDLINAEVAHIKEVIGVVLKHDFSKPRLEVPNVSTKLISLYNYLAQYFERPSSHRCIVFVEQRVVARLLQRVFELIGGSHLRPGVLTGAGSGALDDLQATFRSQVVTLMKFRKGELNCLFATSVAEEGLDVPDCNLVIRFDICKTMIQYVQSRGRARHKNSRFLHMLELNNSVQDRILQDNRYCELLMRRFCEALPADRRLIGNDDIDSVLEADDGMSFTVPSTGAKITSGSSLQLLGHFVSSLPKEGEEIMQPMYITTHHAGKYLCEVKLPERAPIRSIVGKLSTKKAYAKRSAAFEACKQLHERHFLSDNLVPIYTKRLPLMRNAALALNLKKTGNYDMRLKPSVWDQGLGVVPKELHAVTLNVSGGLDRPHQPLLLLTRSRMPAFPEFPLFLSRGRQTQVQITSRESVISVSAAALDKLTVFTLRIFNDVYNKEYEFDPAQMSYWIAPTPDFNSRGCDGNSLLDMIDWAVIGYVNDNEGFEWTPDMPDDFLLDKFFIDKWDGGRRFFSERIASEHKPLDPVPDNTATGKWNANILDYSISLWSKARKSRTWQTEQPVVEVDKVRHRRNMLAEPHHKEAKEEDKPTRCFVCPQPLKISAIPPKTVSMSYVFPAIIHRIEAYLVALEACSRLGLDVKVELALEAVTKDSDNSEDHQGHERINFQSGMGKNYERLEFLGDCFLKMATSISVFTQNPNDNEFDFHVKRMLLLCNKNLFNVAQTLKISEYIRSQAFTRRNWYPTGMKLLKGKATNTDVKHSLGDKTIADVCEAIMGAAFLTHNRQGFWKPEDWNNAVVAVTKLVGSEDHTMMQWSDYGKAYEKPTYQVTEGLGTHLDVARKVEIVHDYHFHSPKLLWSAFTHPSWPANWCEGIPSYQRLEFLGDSLLDMACICHIFYNYPDKDPQWLTEHKMAMVSNKFLGAVCVMVGFHKHILHNSDILTAQIAEYVEELESAEKAARGAKDFWTTVKDPPKCLPDMVEAYIGAVFIDSDFDYNEVLKFFDKHIKPYFEDMTIYDTYANNHPVTRLHSILRDNFGCDDFQLFASEEATGDDSTADVVAGLMIHDHPEPIGAWRAKSGRYAKVKAALAAAEELQSMPPFEFRATYGCDCHLKEANMGDDGAEQADRPRAVVERMKEVVV